MRKDIEKDWDDLTEDSERLVRLSKFEKAMMMLGIIILILAIFFKFYIGYLGLFFIIAALRSFYKVGGKLNTKGQERRIRYSYNYEEDNKCENQEKFKEDNFEK